MNQTLILLVDGDREGLEHSRASLESLGFLVLAAAGPTEAQRCLETFKPSAILLEVRASDSAGLDIARGLKSQPETRTIPLIGLGAQPDQDVCDAWLTRPFDAARLGEAITHGVARVSR